MVTPFAAVAGLMRKNAASSFVDGACASSARLPSMIESSTPSAI
jgi:hypothetical protein